MRTVVGVPVRLCLARHSQWAVASHCGHCHVGRPISPHTQHTRGCVEGTTAPSTAASISPMLLASSSASSASVTDPAELPDLSLPEVAVGRQPPAAHDPKMSGTASLPLQDCNSSGVACSTVAGGGPPGRPAKACGGLGLCGLFLCCGSGAASPSHAFRA